MWRTKMVSRVLVNGRKPESRMTLKLLQERVYLFVKQMGHSLTDGLAGPEALMRPSQLPVHPQTHTNQLTHANILPDNCRLPHSSSQPCILQSKCVCVYLCLVSVCPNAWVTFQIHLYVLSEQRSVGRFKATQVEIRRAVTERPSQVRLQRQ